MKFDWSVFTIKLPFGLKADKLYHISEVEQGLACECVCPYCKTPLIARKGQIREKHFAHTSEECKYGLETALHLFAKEVLQKYRKLKLPAVLAYEKVVSSEKTFIFDSIDLEKSFNDIRPDVVLYKNSTPLFVEIKVTHEVDNEKISKVIKKGISILEIDLLQIVENVKDFDRDLVEGLIIDDTRSKVWLYNKKAEEEEARIRKAEALIKQAQIKEQKRNDELAAKKLETKIIRIRNLISPQNQLTLKNTWAKEISINSLWTRMESYFNINVDTIPKYLMQDFEGDFVFACDKRIWQSKLFNIFIYNKLKHKKYPCVIVKHVIEFLKSDRCDIPLNKDLVYMGKISEFKDFPTLTEVVNSFWEHLCNYGFLKLSDESERKNGHAYYAFYDILCDSLKFLPKEYNSEDYIEQGRKLFHRKTGEFIGYLDEIYK